MIIDNYWSWFQVFPLKAELLRPREEMERHITDLIKKVYSSIYLLLVDNIHKIHLWYSV